MPKPVADALSAKEQLFADGIIAGKTKVKAATDAGYSAKSAANIAWRLLKKAKIAQYVATHRKEAMTAATLSHEYVLGRLMQIEAGKDTSVAVRALELLGKHMGMFPERSVVVDPAVRSTDDVTKRREVVRKKLGYG